MTKQEFGKAIELAKSTITLTVNRDTAYLFSKVNREPVECTMHELAACLRLTCVHNDLGWLDTSLDNFMARNNIRNIRIASYE